MKNRRKQISHWVLMIELYNVFFVNFTNIGFIVVLMPMRIKMRGADFVRRTTKSSPEFFNSRGYWFCSFGLGFLKTSMDKCALPLFFKIPLMWMKRKSVTIEPSHTNLEISRVCVCVWGGILMAYQLL